MEQTKKPRFEKNDVVQFTENHKWCGSFGIVNEIKDCNGDFRYLVGVPIPQKGTAYIFSMESAHEFERIGTAFMIEVEEEEDDE